MSELPERPSVQQILDWMAERAGQPLGNEHWAAAMVLHAVAQALDFQTARILVAEAVLILDNGGEVSEANIDRVVAALHSRPRQAHGEISHGQ